MSAPRDRSGRKPRRSRGDKPIIRRGTVRLQHDVARRVRAGHPWVFSDAVGRSVRAQAGDVLELVDWDGEFVARAMFDGAGAIALRALTRDPSRAVDDALFADRVASAVALRERVLADAPHTAYRVINAESDGLPGVTVDRYGDYLVVHLYCPAVERFRDPIYDALESVLSPRAIYEQRRFKSLGGEAPRAAELIRGNAAPVDMKVREGDLEFIVDVTAPLSTGLFPDLRLGREAIRRWSAGRRVLNLFSYTGAISVYAAKGGAAEVAAVDVSAKAHAWARRNFAANGFDAETPENIVGDVFKVLAKMTDRGRTFDLIALDPPAFGQAGKGKPFSAAKDYAELVAASLGLLAPGGVLACVSSTHRITHADFDYSIAQGAASANAVLRIVERQALPPDFPVAPGFAEANYLKCAIAMRD